MEGFRHLESVPSGIARCHTAKSSHSVGGIQVAHWLVTTLSPRALSGHNYGSMNLIRTELEKGLKND